MATLGTMNSLLLIIEMFPYLQKGCNSKKGEIHPSGIDEVLV